MKAKIYTGWILCGSSHGCEFTGILVKRLKNNCALLDNNGERHIVADPVQLKIMGRVK